MLYLRGEYQSAPSAPAPTQAVLNFYSQADAWPNAPALPTSSISRFQLLDSYVGMNFANWQVSYGRRSLWWGPADGGTMVLTNNTPPLNNMFTVGRVAPFRLPWVFSLSGRYSLRGFHWTHDRTPISEYDVQRFDCSRNPWAVWEELASCSRFSVAEKSVSR